MFNHVWWFFSLSLCFLLFVVATIPTTNKTNRRRYKILCANAIKEPCDPQKATQLILDAINLEPELYRMGNTKVLDAFGLLWNGVAVALYIIHRRKLSILQLFFFSNFFSFYFDNEIFNVSSFSFSLLSSYKESKLEEMKRIWLEDRKFLINPRCAMEPRSLRLFFARHIAAERGNFRLAFINIPDYSFLSDGNCFLILDFFFFFLLYRCFSSSPRLLLPRVLLHDDPSR